MAVTITEEFEEILAAARDDVAVLAERLNALFTVGAIAEPSALSLARRLYAQRRLRERYFDAGLFAEPAWDLLLDLYIARIEGRRISTSSACLAAMVPATTGLRWLRKLQQDGLVRRRCAPRDERLTLVEISDEAFASMTRLLIRLGAREG